MSDPQQWFFISNAQKVGPVAEDALIAALAGLAAPGETLVWRSGLSNWTPAASVPEIAASLPPPVPMQQRADTIPSRESEPSIDAERIWHLKSDEQVLQASSALAEYTEEGDRVIRAELRHRGFQEPPPTDPFQRQAIESGERKDEPPWVTRNLENVGKITGWLLFPATSLVLAVLLELLQLASYVESASKGINPNALAAAAFEILLLAFTAVVAVFFFRRHHSAPRLYLVLLGINAIRMLVTPALLSERLALYLLTGLWIQYFLRSRRVKLTFIRTW